MATQIVRHTKEGIGYIGTLLRQRKSVVTRAFFWRVPHSQSNREDIRLKIGRYTRLGFNQESLQATNPKSELTLDDDEFRNLLQFISENYEPFRARETRYLPLDNSLDENNLKHCARFSETQTNSSFCSALSKTRYYQTTFWLRFKPATNKGNWRI